MRTEQELRDMIARIEADSRAPLEIGGKREAAGVGINATLALHQAALSAAYGALRWALGGVDDYSALCWTLGTIERRAEQEEKGSTQ